ncbi:hypothetical protein TRICI_006203 [Trichomonascus ciferrii]|uniref:ferric-chelate reductase (NADPH) n=1 Tax=Trichomonascus ciferrii TaxID=44093 RepID=A0A642UK02_9ASCO|nr:hypothetical protein TRICI_006203 [Trichomonascus ciferrii]
MYDTKARQLLRMLADRAGIVSITQVPMIILFGGRNNFLIWLTGWPIEVFNVYHRWISRGILVLLLVHAISFSLSFTLAGSYNTVWSKPYWIFGITAFSSGAIIFFQSLRVLRQRNYEVFLAAHIALATVFIGAAWNHLKDLGELEYLYAAVAVWGTDRIARIIRIIWSGSPCRAQMVAYEDGVFKVLIDYSKRWKISPGTYLFVSFLSRESFWQFHPFSAVAPLDDKGTLTLYAKAKDGLTRDLYLNLCRQQGHRKNCRVLLEGPYGCQHALYRYEEVFIIAGGVGITGVYNYAEDMRKNPQRDHSVQLIWVIPDERPLEWFGEQIDYLSCAEQFQITVYITGTGNSNIQTEKPTIAGQYRKMRGKPDVDSFVRRCIVNASGKLAVLSCGPGSMNDQVRRAVAENIQSASSRVDYFEESFSW